MKSSGYFLDLQTGAPVVLPDEALSGADPEAEAAVEEEPDRYAPVPICLLAGSAPRSR